MPTRGPVQPVPSACAPSQLRVVEVVSGGVCFCVPGGLLSTLEREESAH